MSQPKSDSRAIVVFSGGQDSTTALFWARKTFSEVTALTFDYGQKHRIELECAADICRLWSVPQVVLPINTFSALGGNSLVDHEQSMEGELQGLPASFVPGRNLVFLTFAAAWGWPRSYRDLVTGVCQTDYSGYPDCRSTTMESLQTTLGLGMDAEFRIHTPLMHLTKAETVHMAVELGALPALGYSHTCYEGQRPPCGKCASCLLRAKGFAEAGIKDPLLSNASIALDHP